MIEDLTGVPVVGVVPYSEINIADEDSLIDKMKEANKGFTIEEADKEIENFSKSLRKIWIWI